MNHSGQALLWCVLQITVLSIVAMAIGAIIGRRRPSAGALVAGAGFVAVIGLSLAAFSPWPTWKISRDSFGWHDASAPDHVNIDQPALFSAIERSPLRAVDDRGWDRISANRILIPNSTVSFWERSRKLAADHWGVCAFLLYLVGGGVMAVRMGWGLAAVRDYRRRSRPITDREMTELVDVVSAELSCSRDIELREAAALGTPATIGWRHPILLLPSDWSSWTHEQRLAVLAHEIEHIRRGDFLSWIVAQVGVTLHFYHPVVHALAARLRLQQELAADAAAAQVLGGQRTYVAILAAMALRQSDVPVAWPARAFLPTSKTFLRRIEMLHRSTSLRGDLSRPLAFASLLAVTVAAICVAGFRGSVAAADRPAANQAAPLDSAANGSKLPQSTKSLERLRETRNHLKQLGLAMHNYYATYQHFPPAVVMGPDGKTPHSWRVELLPYLDAGALFNRYHLNEPWDSPNNKQLLEEMPEVFRSPFDDPNSTNSSYYVFSGPGTVFDGKKGVEFRDIHDGTSNTLLVVESKRSIPWTKPEDIPFDPEKPLPQVGGFLKGEFAATLADGSARVFNAEKAKDYLKWLIMRNDGRLVDWKVIDPQTSQRRPAPRRVDPRTQSQQNVKVLMLAMFNYHDVHAHFPPAAVPDRGGKNVMHSWRVELLPYLDEESLYKQYRMDEPWNSPANKKVLEQMPSVFRDPYDDAKSTNAGYFGLVGPGTMFEGNNGIRIRDVTDGTSNTLMLVEAKRSIPWTKPEDIAFDPDKPLPELGGYIEGGFFTGMGDGSARFLPIDQVKDQLKWLIMRNDGHRIHEASPLAPN